MSDECGTKFAVGDRVRRVLHDFVLIVKSVQNSGSTILYECVREGDPDPRPELCSQRFLRPACSSQPGVEAQANIDTQREGHAAADRRVDSLLPEVTL